LDDGMILDFARKRNHMEKHSIITISRQFGSGGHEIGKRLAEELGYKFYDNELINLAAAASGLSKDVFTKSEEAKALPEGSLLADSNNKKNDKIFAIKADVIKHIAERGDCIIVGRCADYILESWDTFDVFVHAPEDSRINRLMKMHADWDEKTAKKHIKSNDNDRAGYYKHYTGRDWGQAYNYTLCLDSGAFGVDGCVKAIIQCSMLNIQ